MADSVIVSYTKTFSVIIFDEAKDLLVSCSKYSTSYVVLIGSISNSTADEVWYSFSSFKAILVSSCSFTVNVVKS
jgi:hypothetical protein